MTASDGKGVGASLLRKEDGRLMRGAGRFIADSALVGQNEVAFLRSPVAHARIIGFDIPDDIRARVFIHADMTGVEPIRADSSLPGFKSSAQPPLVDDKVRHVGELVAMCMAPTRAASRIT